jgi:transcriptional regulator with GAF, ATPase, and Fis domain
MPQIKSKAKRLVTILFFVGVVVSAVTLYMLPNKLNDAILVRIYTTIGLTFIFGLISIQLTARSIRETIVYLEHKKEEDKEGEVNSANGVQSQLSMEPIDKIIGSRNASAPQLIINELCQQLQAGQGAIYVSDQQTLELKYGFALSYDNGTKDTYSYGEGLVGRVAADGNSLYLDKLPKDYITVFSGLGSSSPSYLVIVPIRTGNEIKGAIEIATFSPINKSTIQHLEQTGRSLAEIAL